ncbi:ABC transporter permease [Kosmotoga olearia]|uniref:Inner-membrane translocator n=1 Tax=Kosmotoga olearia (strain ATCC BAA-1733 / DSM 21960 / TBF 19.5.1) TaxID=521045 RepID=C5CJ33_KOSOT|nr:ABC transporter permease [Kosmotoga olearia]ACR79949.1 inner-membrane translocator [Kosmotoga olearia TBF 19.5.1]
MKNIKRYEVYRTILAIAIALLLGYLLIFFTSMPKGDMPLGEKLKEAFQAANKAFKVFLTSPLVKERRGKVLFNLRGFIQWMNESVPIIITGLAVSLVFTAKQFNIGAEGQLFIGAAVASFAAIYFPAIPIIHPIVVILLASLTGAAWASVPAIMKSKLNASELVTSLMMNYVALYMGLFIIKVFLRDPNAGQLVSLPYKETSMLFLINSRYRWHIGIIIALVMSFLLWFIVKRTTWGYKVRLIGNNKNFAYYSGINTSRTIFQVQVVSGAIAGMAGIIELIGYHGRFLWLFSPGYGWDGIIIATLARNNPLFVPIAALFLSYIRVGAKTMGRYTNIPPEIVSILQATIILLVTAEAFLSRLRQKAIEKEAKANEPNNVAVAGGDVE